MIDVTKLFEDQKLDAYVILTDSNRFYFSQFDCSFGCVVLTKDVNVVMTDFRYEIAAREKLTDCEVRIVTYSKLYDEIASVLKKVGAKKVGYETNITVEEFTALKASLKEYTLKPATAQINNLRAVKSDWEIERIRSAQAIAEKALQKAISLIKTGMTERDLMAEINYEMAMNGADNYSFETIVAFGANTAMPHHVPDNTKLEKNHVILVDMGAKKDGYCSDMTRTFCLDEPSELMVTVYNIVLEAQLYALKYIKAGMTGHEADSLAREIITANGYGKEFGHSLGHGVGVDIHECPRLGLNSKDILQPNTIVTVEPGIYIPDVGGVRIEDFVVVKENGIENLTTFDKKFII